MIAEDKGFGLNTIATIFLIFSTRSSSANNSPALPNDFTPNSKYIATLCTQKRNAERIPPWRTPAFQVAFPWHCIIIFHRYIAIYKHHSHQKIRWYISTLVINSLECLAHIKEASVHSSSFCNIPTHGLFEQSNGCNSWSWISISKLMRT